jgi:curved DNA-binding protein CbpA
MGELERCYEILGVKPSASMAEVNKAYKTLVVIWHPDRIEKHNTSLLATAERKLKELNHARDTLRERAAQTNTADRHAADRPPSAAQKAERTQRHHPYAAYRAQHQSAPRETASRESASRDSRPPTPTSAPPRDRHQDYYAQSRYNPAYAQPEVKVEVKVEPSPPAPKPPVASPPPESYYRSPSVNPMGYSPPRHVVPAGPPQPDLSDADFHGRDLSEKDLSNRNMRRSNLSQANLSDAFLHRINLEGANLEGANLFRANLLEANLNGANLRDVNLIGADLSGCDLRGADLTGAKVGFDGRVMVKMTGARLLGAIMPNGKVYEG